jgi:hypothetical protein
MKLRKISIRNFRGLQSIDIELDKQANVIVGPNAIGKTTVLEAIRLTKAILAPRVPDEPQHALVSLGAVSPHNPQNFNYSAICGVESQVLNIVAQFTLDSAEIAELDQMIPDLAIAAVRASLGNSFASGQIPIVQFLSTPAGTQALTAARNQITQDLPSVKTRGTLTLDLTIDPAAQVMRGANPLDQMIFSAFESGLPPYQTLFSYFPADRALPVGEVPIQVGGADVMTQLQAHNSQPQSKYGRLKPTIINNILFGLDGATQIDSEFNRIFSKLLKDRVLVGTSINKLGLVSVKIKQIGDGRIFDIDAMSSGEKGLILTFLLISYSMADKGIILIDEPELHLNPAVCKLLLPYLIDEHLKPKNIQAIICSHSPELLGSAFDREDCSLHHLQSPTIISKIYPEDKREVFDALKRLGTSASDVLFSNGSIYVEGEHDIEILQTGFSKLLSRYHIAHLGGRGPVEQEIKALQEAEKKNEIDTLKCFIFDLDEKPTSLASTRLVKVLQWKRRCLENFLIEEKIIYDLLNQGDVSQKSIQSRGEVASLFKEIALSQLLALVTEKTYNALDYENPGLRPKEISGKNFQDSARGLFARIAKIQTQVCSLNEEEWCKSFVQKCEARYEKEKLLWEVDWLTLCDGKRFIKDLHSKYEVKVSPLRLKKLIIEKMEKGQSENWILVEKQIADALQS